MIWIRYPGKDGEIQKIREEDVANATRDGPFSLFVEMEKKTRLAPGSAAVNIGPPDGQRRKGQKEKRKKSTQK